ncbi:MAG: UDP-N-acetylmuramoyl-L-alanine--D-glutamate ligase [Bdellovibrionales bacterium CG10_big_fil_rev_8_21_14_0_10_45_34]|nr:MAG: UDP-N-acetylmuramoyl-L-alanine--D-glutamate ligase [Bdellovibrionales bacterium CG10_big_fil_rev_8_21_14_0_10_45_34]
MAPLATLVLGAGKSGIAVMQFLAKSAAVYLYDDNWTDNKREQIKPPEKSQRVKIFNQKDLAEWQRGKRPPFEQVCVSPGVPPNHPVIKQARKHKMLLTSETEFALRNIDKPIIAITGTNGKTTTTMITGHLLKSANRRVFIGGNIGTPLIQAVSEANEIVVAELSSFQIDITKSRKVNVAAITNISANHLDRYGSMRSYLNSKVRLILDLLVPGGSVVLNADDVHLVGWYLKNKKLLLRRRNHVFWFSGKGKLKSNMTGLFLRGDCLMGQGELSDFNLRHTSFTLIGKHNLENLMVAILTAKSLVPDILLDEVALASFVGAPHRMELVAKIEDRQFVNDSKATTPASLEVSIDSVADHRGILILGGREKGGSILYLKRKLSIKCKMIVLIGETKDRYQKLLEELSPVQANDMEDAIAIAIMASEPADTILLSPACASYDMFRDFEHRGEKFKREVNLYR